MRAVMNGLSALGRRTGVGQYAARLHAELAPHGVALYPPAGLAAAVRRGYRASVGGAGGPASWLGRAKAVGLTTAKHAAKVAVGIHFARECRAAGYELYHEPNFLPFAADLPTVVTVHDLSVMKHPRWHPADRVKNHDRHFGPALRRAAHVIVVSEAVRRELIADGVPAAKVTAVPNGVGPMFRPRPSVELVDCRRRLGLPPRYLLCVGTIEPRKNVHTLLTAFADLPAAVREACPLVLAGPWGWKSEPERAFFETAAKPLGARHLGYVPDADLPAVYGGANALLFPTFYEGFGLPPLEMLACGGAVVCSSASAAVREVVGPCGEYVHPLDVAGWREAMRRAATDADWLRAVRAGGIERAARFTWTRTAAETLTVYRGVLGRNTTRSAA